MNEETVPDLVLKAASLHCDVEDILPEDVGWNIDVTDVKLFIHWFINYIDGSNSLTAREFREYHDWIQDGFELQGENLDQILANYGSDVSKFSSTDLSHFDYELINEEVDALKIQDETISDVIKLLSDQSQISLINEETLEKKLKTAQLECQREGQNLMKISVPLKSSLSTIVQRVSYLLFALSDTKDPDVFNRFISNVSLDNFIFLGEKFSEYTNQLLKQEFEQSSYEKQSMYELKSFLDHDQSMRTISSSLNTTSGLPNKIWKAGVRKIALHGTVSGYNSEIHCLENVMKTGLLGKLSTLQMQLEVDKFQREISRLTQEIDLILHHEGANLIEDTVLSYMIQVTDSITRARINRRKLRLRKLCTIINKTNKYLHITDLLWMLLIIESQQRKFSTEVFKEFSDFLKGEFDKHKATMEGLGLVNNKHRSSANGSSSGQFLLMGILQRLANLDKFDNDSGNGTLYDSMPQLESELKELESTELLDVLQSHQEYHSVLESSLYNLCLKLSSGPTKKPELVKKDLNIMIQDIGTKLQKFWDEFGDLSHSFSVKQLAFKKSILARNRRLLWAWFLTSHDKLEKALSLAEKESRGKK